MPFGPSISPSFSSTDVPATLLSEFYKRLAWMPAPDVGQHDTIRRRRAYATAPFYFARKIRHNDFMRSAAVAASPIIEMFFLECQHTKQLLLSPNMAMPLTLCTRGDEYARYGHPPTLSNTINFDGGAKAGPWRNFRRARADVDCAAISLRRRREICPRHGIFSMIFSLIISAHSEIFKINKAISHAIAV